MDRALFALLIVVTGALGSLIEGLATLYYPGPASILAVTFTIAVTDGVIVYLATEQKDLPA